MDDTFDIAFKYFSEESEIRRSIRIEQGFACKAMGVLLGLLAKL
jgi:hypothetical protein